MSEIIITKRCPKCNEIKPISEFHKNRCAKDGYGWYCKICHNKATHKYQRSEKGKETQKRYKQSIKGKATQHTAKKRFYACNPNQLKAVRAVNNAISDGKLPRPDSLQCHYCPEQAKQYHHWHGYAPEHWLDVVPICRKCHISIKLRQ